MKKREDQSTMSRRELFTLPLILLFTWFFVFIATYIWSFAFILGFLHPYIIAKIAGRRYFLYGTLANFIFWLWGYIDYRFINAVYPEGIVHFYTLPLIMSDLFGLAIMLLCSTSVCLAMQLLEKRKPKPPPKTSL